MVLNLTKSQIIKQFKTIEIMPFSGEIYAFLLPKEASRFATKRHIVFLGKLSKN